MSNQEETPIPSSKAIPTHVAIIMDGNNRWAKRNGLRSSAGHRAGVEAIRGILRELEQRGVRIVTLFAFSSENWQRPSAEVNALMRLFSNYLDNEVRQLHKDGVRIRFIGRRDRFSRPLFKQMDYAEQLTRFNKKSVVAVAVDYGGQWDITQAARQLAERVASGRLRVEDIDERSFDECTVLSDLPKPDLCIRTAGEQRLSNFMLWQLAYAEFYFSPVLWPDFGARDVAAALDAYADRERRFGSRDEAAPEKNGDFEGGVGHA